MTLSTRYALPLAIVLALALVPTLVHSYAGVTRDDGRRARDLKVQFDGASGIDTPRKADWVRRRLASEDWFERRYVIGDREVTLFVGRSYDPKSLYHHPELALAYGYDLESRGVINVGGLPVHALVTRTGEPHIVLYALEENGDFVNDPIPFQIRSTLTGLVRGRSAMTLFFALEGGRPDSDDLSTTVAAHLLSAAVDAFKTAR